MTSAQLNQDYCAYPGCWDYLTQCHGDTDNDSSIGLTDFYEFSDSWNKSYPNADYLAHPCADVNRDGSVGLTDFYQFSDYWNKSVPSDCSSQGDINSVYCP